MWAGLHMFPAWKHNMRESCQYKPFRIGSKVAMIVICRNCGAVNNIRQDKKLPSVINITCRQCGAQTSLELGVTSRSIDKVKCHSCGYKQPKTERCAKCGADMVFRPMEVPIFEELAEKKPKILTSRYKVLTVTAVLLLLILFLGILTSVFLMMKSSDAYQTAETFIKNNKNIKETVGDRMKFGFLPLGSVKVSGQTGVANFKINVKGSRGSTQVNIFLRKQRGVWRVVAATYTDRYGSTRRITPSVNQKK